MSNNVPAEFSREMGLTLEEFLRTLPAAVKPLNFQSIGRRFTIAHPQGSVQIELHETRERRIASMCLPVTLVEFRFKGLNAGQRQAFMERFDLCFHRGGG